MEEADLIIPFEQRTLLKIFDRQNTGKQQLGHNDSETTNADRVALLFPVEHISDILAQELPFGCRVTKTLEHRLKHALLQTAAQSNSSALGYSSLRIC